jgi:hypothetical protein
MLNNLWQDSRHAGIDARTINPLICGMPQTEKGIVVRPAALNS